VNAPYLVDQLRHVGADADLAGLSVKEASNHGMAEMGQISPYAHRCWYGSFTPTSRHALELAGTESLCQKQKKLSSASRPIPSTPGAAIVLLAQPYVDKVEASEMARVRLPASDPLVMHYGPVPP